MHRARASTTVFHAIADPTRRAMLEQLSGGECTAGDLGRSSRLSQPALSQHLRVLREAGLVRQRKDGRHRWYALEPTPLADVADWVRYFDRFWDRRLARLTTYLDRKRTK